MAHRFPFLPSLRRWLPLLLVTGGLDVFAAEPVGGAPAPAAPPVPGSAVLAPKSIEEPMPESPAGVKTTSIRLGLWIREDGSVDAAEMIKGDQRWRDAAIAAAKRWRFEPVRWEGRAIPARAELVFTQMAPGNVRTTLSPLPNLPGEIHTEEEFGLTKPVLIRDLDAIMPLVSRASRQSLDAVIRFIVGEEGTAGRFEILGASSEVALRVALDVLQARTYQSGTVRGQPVDVAYKQMFSFSAGTERPLEILSGAITLLDPVYPADRLLAREEGSAVVRVTLDERGLVKTSELVEASHPDFGAALLAAADSWRFTPEAAAVQPLREYRHEFRLESVSYGTRRLADLVRGGGKVSASRTGLDAIPKLVGAPALAYPRQLLAEGPAGSADVEFVIDRAGLAQLPRVTKATHPAFGWAAATFVNSMRFVPPTRGGKPTDLRVVFPIKFAPPKPSAPPASAASAEPKP